MGLLGWPKQTCLCRLRRRNDGLVWTCMQHQDLVLWKPFFSQIVVATNTRGLRRVLCPSPKSCMISWRSWCQSVVFWRSPNGPVASTWTSMPMGTFAPIFHEHFEFHNFRNSKLGFHADDEPLHFSQNRDANDSRHFVIGSFSLGSSRSFLVKHKATKEITTLRLGQGDLIAMCGNLQDKFIHW